MDIKNLIYSAPPRVTARIIAFILALAVAFAGAKIMTQLWDIPDINSGLDDPQSNQPTNTGKEPENKEEEVKQHFITEGAANVGTVINAKNAVLCVMDEATVKAQKEMNSTVPLKEATVFMVALTVSRAISEGKVTLNDEAVCPATAASSPTYALSAQVLPIGKKMKVGDILKCMLYQNGSSYAYTLAVHISGSTEAFTEQMNDYAKILDIKSAVFTNCTGDDDGGASINAYDFAVIMKYFLADIHLKSIFCSSDMITVGNSENASVALVVKNDFFENFCTESQAKSDGIVGGKVGKQSYLSFACVIFEKNGKTYLSAVFESEEPFSDALMLYSAYALSP